MSTGILFLLALTIRWVQAGGSFCYDATFANDPAVGGYPKGAVLLRADLAGFWFNLADNNTTDPDATDANDPNAARNWVPVNADWNAVSGPGVILNRPDLAEVATSGSYSDLTGRPAIPAAQVNSDWNAGSGVAAILNRPALAAVATSGSYDDLSNRPPPATNNPSVGTGNAVVFDWVLPALNLHVDGQIEGQLYSSAWWAPMTVGVVGLSRTGRAGQHGQSRRHPQRYHGYRGCHAAGLLDELRRPDVEQQLGSVAQDCLTRIAQRGSRNQDSNDGLHGRDAPRLRGRGPLGDCVSGELHPVRPARAVPRNGVGPRGARAADLR
ncbi:hypothetical protein G3A43_40595 [Paraburkholderia aspalathi]|uniref:hypothetical protein n=1 Tax=Paraburkholderia nemoris TaxID=2793076 RepID=UPI00190AD377|nr:MULTISPECIES: hypothetical protein [Paraburkholderia]MBK3786502.1 hypothetical protein [Paraburkholderia aspalathi]